jgi:hypothetical protein
MRKRQNVNPISDDNLKIKLIKMFLKSNKTIYNEISKAIDDRDIVLAHRMAHTLKSNAGMLGKTNLQKAASEVESFLVIELNTGVIFDPGISEMKILETELEVVVKEFELFLTNAALSEREGIVETKPKAEILSVKEALTLIDELEILLDGGNTECMNLIDSLRLIPDNGAQDMSLAHGLLVRELIHHIEFFEFDLAKGTIVQLREKLMETGDE